jgi:hypothetical protein
MLKHKHFWVPYAMHSVGYWSKRDDTEDGIYFKGKVEQCEKQGCLLLRFVCDDPRLRIVEVTK